MEKLFEMFAKVVTTAAVVVLMLTFAALLSAFPVKWAWNCSMPGIFSLKEIGFWEAFCLIWLSGAFVKANAVKPD